MNIQKKLVERIINNCNLVYRGIHNGIAYYMVDHCKMSFKVKEDASEEELRTGLINRLKSKIDEITININYSWSGCMSISLVDPWSVKRLLEKYIEGQYIDLSFKENKRYPNIRLQLDY